MSPTSLISRACWDVFKKTLSFSYFAIAESPIWVYNARGEGAQINKIQSCFHES
jgi:hypothetical protein